MRQSFLLFIGLLLPSIIFTQIYGNGNLETKTVDLIGLEEIDIQLYLAAGIEIVQVYRVSE